MTVLYITVNMSLSVQWQHFKLFFLLGYTECDHDLLRWDPGFDQLDVVHFLFIQCSHYGGVAMVTV